MNRIRVLVATLFARLQYWIKRYFDRTVTDRHAERAQVRICTKRIKTNATR